MGSYAKCWAGKFYLGSIKDEENPVFVSLFRPTDKKVIVSNKANLPSQLSEWAEDLEEEEEVNEVFYSAPVKVIKARLELAGHTLTNSIKAYTFYLDREISRYEKRATESHKHRFQPKLEILREMNVDNWLSALQEIYDGGLTRNGEDRNKALLSYMLRENWYGFPIVDLNIVLRLILEVIPENESFTYDLTELIFTEYFDLDTDLGEYVNYNIKKTIILTEGKWDTLVLSESLNLLYPHLADYFTFMDFDGAKVGGGAVSLANMVKSFSGAGIINKVVAVFDNDTAAQVAINGLQKSKISKNIKVFTLPDIDILNDYPTIGLSGMGNMNVNGLAGSIEPYLGKECLEDANGLYYPIQWTGLKDQGNVIEKGEVQKNFKKKLKRCNQDRSSLDEFDWSGIKEIFEGIFNLFHEDDGQEIMSFVEKYYG